MQKMKVFAFGNVEFLTWNIGISKRHFPRWANHSSRPKNDFSIFLFYEQLRQEPLKCNEEIRDLEFCLKRCFHHLDVTFTYKRGTRLFCCFELDKRHSGFDRTR